VTGLLAVLVILIRYFGHERLLSRTVAVGGGLAGAAVFLFIPPAFTAGVRSAFVHAPAAPSIRLDQRPPDPGLRSGFENALTVAVPVTVDGIPQGRLFTLQALTAEIVGRSGDHYNASIPPYNSHERPVIRAYFWFPEGRQPWLQLTLDRTVYARLQASGTRLSGKALVSIYRYGETRWMPLGVNQSVPGVGRCTSVQTEDYIGGGLKVVCESPSSMVGHARVRLVSRRDGQEWGNGIGEYGGFAPGPRDAWLSPVQRRQAFFRLTDNEPKTPDRWVVPRSALASAEIGVTPYAEFGYAVVHYDLRDVALSKFVIAPPPP
jgi:hypothetical protein